MWGRVPAIEFVKKNRKIFFWYSPSVVRYSDGNMVCVYIRGKRNAPAVRRVPDRIFDQIGDYPRQVLRVAPELIPPGVSAPEAERLIPFVAAYVDDVDLKQGRITVDWGLDY